MQTHRSEPCEKGRLTWEERHFYSILFEILQNIANALFKHISLLFLKGGTIVAAMLLELLLKLNHVQDHPGLNGISMEYGEYPASLLVAGRLVSKKRFTGL